MKRVLSAWFNKYFSDPQAVFLTIALAVVFVVIFTMGKMLLPLIASVIIAYLLEGIAEKLESYKIPRFLAVLMVFLLFVTVLLLLIFGILPLLSRQITQFFGELPNMLEDLRQLILQIPVNYP